ncbi:flagella basal body P-ring formation protein FlgA [Sphingobium subterraneum]|nr:flagella basal body P-ring formation protein FlgA [Sphingobium subterraneum]
MIAVLLVGMSASPVFAQQKFENLDRIDGLVAMTVGANLGEPGGPVSPVDRRLRLAACPEVPDVQGPVFGAAIVQCKTLGWRIRVPLSVSLQGSGTPSAAPASYMRPRTVAPASREIVVKKGDPVQLVAGGAAFQVSRMMIADEDGAAGQMIRVREDRKSDPVLAQVVEIGIVRAPGFKDF